MKLSLPIYHFIRLLLLLACATALAACAEPTQTTEPEIIGGGVNPASVTENFFEDFGKALNDPTIQSSASRRRWADILADYFAPSEREEHRSELSQMLASYAAELQTEVGPGEQFTIELRYDQPQQVSRNQDRALVQVTNGSIYWKVTRDGYLIDEQETPLNNIIGRDDNAVPTVQVGANWFLTDTYE